MVDLSTPSSRHHFCGNRAFYGRRKVQRRAPKHNIKPCYAQLSPERRHNGQIAVEADEADVEDGGRAEHDVEGGPDGTEGLSQHPALTHLAEGGGDHHHRAYQQVGQRQRHDEQVGHGPQLLVAAHRQEHQHVAHQGQQGQQAKGHARGYAPGAERGLARGARHQRGLGHPHLFIPLGRPAHTCYTHNAGKTRMGWG